tara:strand:- start:211 stop:384 length:174 start_codon:yes stop_codon:yes gene_type:complete
MESLKSIILETADEDIKVDLHTLKAKSFTGVERKLKGKHIIAILRIDDDKYMAFIEE